MLNGPNQMNKTSLHASKKIGSIKNGKVNYP